MVEGISIPHHLSIAPSFQTLQVPLYDPIIQPPPVVQFSQSGGGLGTYRTSPPRSLHPGTSIQSRKVIKI